MSDGISAGTRQSVSAGVIVLFGVKGSGKDTVADRLVNLYRFRKDSFASPMKQMCEIAFPAIPKNHWYGPSGLREIPCRDYEFSGPCLACGSELAEVSVSETSWWLCQKCEIPYPKYVTPRLALQTLGTEWGQRMHKSLWAKATMHKATPGTCVTDGRFRHELDAAHASGALSVLLMRGREETLHKPNLHISEQVHQVFKPDEFHVIMHTDKYTLDNLDDGVVKLFEIAAKHMRAASQPGQWNIAP